MQLRHNALRIVLHLRAKSYTQCNDTECFTFKLKRSMPAQCDSVAPSYFVSFRRTSPRIWRRLKTTAASVIERLRRQFGSFQCRGTAWSVTASSSVAVWKPLPAGVKSEPSLPAYRDWNWKLIVSIIWQCPLILAFLFSDSPYSYAILMDFFRVTSR